MRELAGRDAGTRLDEHDACTRQRELIRDEAARRAGSDDADVVERRRRATRRGTSVASRRRSEATSVRSASGADLKARPQGPTRHMCRRPHFCVTMPPCCTRCDNGRNGSSSPCCRRPMLGSPPPGGRSSCCAASCPRVFAIAMGVAGRRGAARQPLGRSARARRRRLRAAPGARPDPSRRSAPTSATARPPGCYDRLAEACVRPPGMGAPRGSRR